MRISMMREPADCVAISSAVPATSSAVQDGAVYVGSTDHRVYALDAHNGHLLWSDKTGGVVNWLPAIGA